MPLKQPGGEYSPIRKELNSLDQIFVASANVIDLIGTPRDSSDGPMFDANWLDEKTGLRFLLESRLASVNGLCLQYNLYVHEQLSGKRHFEHFRYDESLKDIEIFNETDTDVTNKWQHAKRVSQLYEYLESAPLNNEDVDGTFEIIMAVNNIQDPRFTRKVRRFARRAIRGFSE